MILRYASIKCRGRCGGLEIPGGLPEVSKYYCRMGSAKMCTSHTLMFGPIFLPQLLSKKHKNCSVDSLGSSQYNYENFIATFPTVVAKIRIRVERSRRIHKVGKIVPIPKIISRTYQIWEVSTSDPRSCCAQVTATKYFHFPSLL